MVYSFCGDIAFKLLILTGCCENRQCHDELQRTWVLATSTLQKSEEKRHTRYHYRISKYNISKKIDNRL